MIDMLPKEDKQDWKKLTQAIVKWLCHHASFGTLDSTVQRAAMASPD
jgi:hypothetical protein